MPFRITLKSFYEGELDDRIEEHTSKGWKLIKRGKYYEHKLAEQTHTYWAIMEGENNERILSKRRHRAT